MTIRIKRRVHLVGRTALVLLWEVVVVEGDILSLVRTIILAIRKTSSRSARKGYGTTIVSPRRCGDVPNMMFTSTTNYILWNIKRTDTVTAAA